MKNLIKIVGLIVLSISLFSTSFAQSKEKEEEDKKDDVNAIYNGLKFRSIGPALMSGRISDIVFNPDNESVWYVTVGGNLYSTNKKPILQDV